MKQLWAPWRMEYISGTESTDGCFICSAAASGSDVAVHSDEHTVTLLNRFPYSSGHLLVAPRSHLPDLSALEGDEAAALVRACHLGMAALQQAFHPDGFNLGLNLGTAAGASVEHLHFHVVPRWNGDTNFMPVLADTKVLPQHLTATAEALRQAFAEVAGRS